MNLCEHCGRSDGYGEELECLACSVYDEKEKPMRKLTMEPARTDLSDREAAKLIGGLVGVLLQMSDERTVRAALRWWADMSDDEWKVIRSCMTNVAGMAVGSVAEIGLPKKVR